MRICRPLVRLAVGSFALAFVACGGGEGGGGGGDDATLLTADVRGWTAAPGAPQGTAAAGGEASDAALDVAREIREADLHRVEGDTLYLLNAHRGLAVVDLSRMEVVGRLPLGGHPHEMFVGGGRALVLLSAFDGLSWLVDVSLALPASPAENGRWPLGGSYRASRLVGDVLYAATDSAVSSFLVGTSVAPVDTAPLPHSASFVHATDEVLVVAGFGTGFETPIALLDVSDPSGDIALRGTFDLAGWVADEHKLHVAGDVLRVVTHEWTDGGLSHLYTVDLSDLDLPMVLGSLDLARGEQLFATRFTDDLAFVVTFEQVDPLWVIDLRNPSAPVVAGELVVPGWSTHLVPTGDGRLVAIGVDATDGWRTTASLFDVSNPAAPALLDRADLGLGWSYASGDAKALGVFPADGLVLVPFSGETERLDVLDLSASNLDLRGSIESSAVVQRGFVHARGIVAISTEEAVLAHVDTLAVLGRATIAENVVDACRLPNGVQLELVAAGRAGRLGGVDLPLLPERLYPHGFRVAVVGSDDQGRAARVVDFSGPSPVVSERFDLGGAWFVLGSPSWGAAVPEGGAFWIGSAAADAALTGAGRLVVHGLPGLGDRDGVGPVTLSSATDGFVVIDVAASRLDPPVLVSGGAVTGFVADGEDLVFTFGSDGGADEQGRPRLHHDLQRVDLATRAATPALPVPGAVVAVEGDLSFLVRETWGDGWSYETTIVASRLVGAGFEVVDALPLPEGAYDLRTAGATLWFSTMENGGGGGGGGGGPGPLQPDGSTGVAWADPGLWAPVTTIGTVRLGSPLRFGPSLPSDGHFVTMLLPEDGSALLVRDGVAVERHDASGPGAVRLWSLDTGGYPLSARADPASAGSYFVAMGYGGLLTAP